jgi:hypothetical protein
MSSLIIGTLVGAAVVNVVLIVVVLGVLIDAL